MFENKEPYKHAHLFQNSNAVVFHYGHMPTSENYISPVL